MPRSAAVWPGNWAWQVGGMNLEPTYQPSTLGWVTPRTGPGAPPAPLADLPCAAGAPAISHAGDADPHRRPGTSGGAGCQGRAAIAQFPGDQPGCQPPAAYRFF